MNGWIGDELMNRWIDENIVIRRIRNYIEKNWIELLSMSSLLTKNLS